MSASPKPLNLPPTNSSRKASVPSKKTRQPILPPKGSVKNSRKVSKPNNQVVSLTGRPLSKFPSSTRKHSLWMRSLHFIHRSSSLFAGSLIVTTVLIYAWTFETQQQWSREYQKLDQLLRHERQTTPFKENLKDQLANEAENPETGLIPPTPDHLIFLNRPKTEIAETPAESSSVAPKSPLKPEITPLGY